MTRSQTIAAILILSAVPAMAGDLTLSAGRWNPRNSHTIDNNLNPLDIAYDSGYQLAAAIGGSSGAVRIENELAYRTAEAQQNRGKMSALTLMFNAWFNLRNSSPFTPYVGGGVGYARGSMASPGAVDNTGSHAAYQYGGGLDFRLNQAVSLDFGYRHIAKIGDNTSGGGFNLAGHSFTTGLRLAF